MATSGSCSPPGTKWMLRHVHIENFKTYNLVDREIQQKGMTICTGANGAGKSVFLEAIAFGLGASPSGLRVQSLAELSGKQKNRTEVLLTFQSTKNSDTMVIGSAITNGARVYISNNKTATKLAFSRTMNETLGFPNNCSSYYLSQRAIDAHLKATPQELFKFLCFLAGTDALLAAQDDASRQITIFQRHLREVVAAVKHLEDDVQHQKNRLESFSSVAQIEERLVRANSDTKSAENKHKNATRYHDISACISLVSSLSSSYETERTLLQRLKHRQRARILMTESTGEEMLQIAQLRLQREEVQLSKQKSSLLATTTSLRDISAAIEQLRALSSRNAAAQQQIVATSIPQLIARINSSGATSSTDTINTSILLETKRVQERKAAELAIRTESLFVSCSADATCQLAELSQLENQERILLSRQEELRQRVAQLAVDDADAHARCPTEDDCRKSQHRVRTLQSEVLAMQTALSLPDCRFIDDLEGDLGFLADGIDVTRAIKAGTSSALDVLLSPVLSVRLCSNTDAAARIIQGTQLNHLHDVRLWPMEQLQVETRRSTAYKHTLYEFPPPMANDPVSLLSPRHPLPSPLGLKALYKSVGRFVIVDSDKTAGRVIKSLQAAQCRGVSQRLVVSGCITADNGNKHVIGSLTVAQTDSEEANRRGTKVELMPRYQMLRQALRQEKVLNAAIQQQWDQAAQRKRNSRELISSVIPALAQVDTNVAAISAALQEHRQKVQSTQAELEVIRSKLTEADKHHLAVTSELRELMNSSGESMRQVFQNQQRKRTADLVAERDVLEQTVTRLVSEEHSRQSEIRRLEAVAASAVDTAATMGEKVTVYECKIADLRKVVGDAEAHQKCAVAERASRAEAEYQQAIDEEELRIIRQKKEQQWSSLDDLTKTHGLQLPGLARIRTVPSSGDGNDVDGILGDGDDGSTFRAETCRGILEGALRATKQMIAKDLGDVHEVAIEAQEYFQKTLLALAESRESVVQLRNQRAFVRQQLIGVQGPLGECTAPDNDPDNDDDKDDDDDDDDDGYPSNRRGKSTTQLGIRRREGVERERLQRRSCQLLKLQDMLEKTRRSIDVLSSTVALDSVDHLHQQTYISLRERCGRYFFDLTKGKRIDLVPENPMRLNDGLRFVLLDTAGGGDSRSTDELSGGQRALLGLAFTVSAALHKPAPLYLLDEVDAALDEDNQSTVGAVIASIFRSSQVLCVSHHVTFQSHASSNINVRMHDGVSVVE